MSSPIRHQFVIELYPETTNGAARPLAVVPFEADWQPAINCAEWTAIRKSAAQPIVFDAHEGVVEPVWDSRVGPPYLDGMQVEFPTRSPPPAPLRIPSSYFQTAAVTAANSLVKQGRLEQDTKFRYLVCAYSNASDGGTKPPDAENGLCVQTVTDPLSAEESSLADYLHRGVPHGDQHAGDAPVFFSHEALQEAVQLTRRAGAAETGGILIGHLRRDSARPDVFLEVTAQIPAAHAQQELTQLTFTPETWSAVDAARHLRGKDEIYLGWWHSHPVRQWCSQCPEEKRKACKLSGEFFSSHDVALHRCCFPRAYSVALVISDAHASGLTAPLFGWREGLMVQRGFHILDGPFKPNEASDPPASAAVPCSQPR